MFKYWSIKKYGSKLLPLLEKRYGVKKHYTTHEIRTLVYRKSFNPRYLPLAFILFLESNELSMVMEEEFPHINIADYKKEILSILNKKSYQGYLQILS
ncbi:MAG: hypothetical protein ACI9LM_004189 [Alteromonadaceae bacterium]|jgi:hypothetical protein